MKKIKVYSSKYVSYHAAQGEFDISHSRFLDGVCNASKNILEHRMFRPVLEAEFESKIASHREKGILAGVVNHSLALFYTDSFSSNPITDEMLEKFDFVVIVNQEAMYHSLKRAILEGPLYDKFEFCD